MIEYTPIRLTSSEREMVEENERLRAEISRLRADRRERIATACLAARLSLPGWSATAPEAARIAIRYSDSLIAELDTETSP